MKLNKLYLHKIEMQISRKNHQICPFSLNDRDRHDRLAACYFQSGGYSLKGRGYLKQVQWNGRGVVSLQHWVCDRFWPLYNKFEISITISFW